MPKGGTGARRAQGMAEPARAPCCLRIHGGRRGAQGGGRVRAAPGEPPNAQEFTSG
jgi:hypothetical protein